MKKLKPVWLGLAQGIGITAYILLFVSFIQGVGQFLNENDNPWFMIVPLMAFVISALICSSIALLYPGILFFDGEKKKALLIIMWTGIWLVVLFIALVFLLVGFKT